MNSNFFIITLFYFLSIYSVIGYGKIFCRLFLNKENNLNFGYIGLFGIFFLILYSYLSHFLFSHNYTHNLFILVFGLILFFIFFDKSYKELIFTTLVFLVLSISLLIFKTHDDFPYYHFGYTNYLTENSLLIGVGQFNHGFRTPSSIFYLNSLFSFPFIKFYFFHLASLMIMGFVNIIFLNYMIDKIKNNKFNHIGYFVLLSLIFINIFFSRIAEHGTDRSAQILILLFIFEILILFSMKLINKINISKILIFLGIIISLKSFYILYLIVLLPIIYFLIKEIKMKKTLFLFIKNKIFYLFGLLFVIILTTNLFNTGCLIYPVNLTCFPGLDWSIASSEVVKMNNWYELWSKAGATPNFRTNNPDEYISRLNWVGNWIDGYFFNKVSDFLLGIIFTVILLLGIFYSKIKKKFIINKYTSYVLLFLFILFIEWFYNHPALRYGGYSLIVAIIFIPISILLSTFSTKTKFFKKKIIVLVAITFFIFFLRNVSRINNEVEQYNFKPLSDFSFRVAEGHYRITNVFKCLIRKHEDNDLDNKVCKPPNGILVGKFLNTYKFYFIN